MLCLSQRMFQGLCRQRPTRFAFGLAVAASSRSRPPTLSIRCLTTHAPHNTPTAISKAMALLGSTALGAGLLFAYQSYAAAEPVARAYASSDEVQRAIDELREALPGKNRVVTDADALRTYGFSENSYHPSAPHAVVVRPMSTEDVVRVVDIARRYRVPITAYSGATSLEGHFAGVRAMFSWDLGCLSLLLPDADCVWALGAV